MVLDPFFGTGTSGAVAKKLKRQFIGIDKDASYVEISKRRIDSIFVTFPEADWTEEKQERKKRVPFEDLIKAKIIRVGDVLYTPKTYNAAAFVLANGKLQFNDAVGSIHRIAALIQHTSSCNGWKFWYILRDDQSLLLEDLRSEYVRNHSQEVG
jgi:hypothetical protein